MEDPALNFPKINFFCYHMAYPEVEKIAGLCSLYDNMYVDLGNPVSISGVIKPMWFNDMMKRFLTMAPATKMTWGTDQIVSPMVQQCIEAFWNWQVPPEWERGYGIQPLTEEIKRKIMGETVAGMLGIDVAATLEKTKDDEFARRREPGVNTFLSSVSGS
jgi:predicted TIM-barrel fold metal-dependent hydrolase